MIEWVVLGRDGVINEPRPGGILAPEDIQAIPGSMEAIAELTNAGVKVAVAINQSAVGRGILSAEQLHQIHEHLLQLVIAAGGKLQAIVYCPHLPEEECDCRKPRTGLLDQLEQSLAVNFSNAYLVGDRLSDIQAAKAKGCNAALVRTGKGTRTETSLLVWPKYGKDTKIFNDLAEFTQHITGRG